MPNDFFDFKQFRIVQNACAMKVSTDACIQGAWSPIQANARLACDIGTGTGLLSLMLAQRKPDLSIEALELDPEAAAQASENVASSAFKACIKVVHSDVRNFKPSAPYDLIICNPPFFENSLQSDNQKRMQARHTDTLSLKEIAAFAGSFLSLEGTISLLLPVDRAAFWEREAKEHGLFAHQSLQIRPNRNKASNRVVLHFGRQSIPNPAEQELIIYQEQGVYTAEFSALMASYYLHL
jgi:tRNA1Val (adenine37-N6)-methyltransferase